MADGFIQVPVDSAGKKVDTSEVTNLNTQVVTERQRVAIASGLDPSEVASVEDGALVIKEPEVREILFKILAALEDIREILAH